ncbi:MAG: DUF3488 domain-containing protein, partial [Elusimicrobia bacterium]|nr:DUF3488 domain-containing protein [Elusimicrobiota bacterium]
MTRPTALGAGCALAWLLTLIASFSSGNNLLYLLHSGFAALYAVGWVWGRRNARGVALSGIDAPGAVRGRPASLRLRLANRSARACYELRVTGCDASLASLAGGAETEVSARLSLAHRGLNRLQNVAVESSFPFGLWLHRSPGPGPVLLALPPASPGAAERGEGDGSPEGRSAAAAAGEEFHGVRGYESSDDPRRINWKLTARTGAVFVNDYRAQGGGRRTVRLETASERAIEAAAGACRAGVESGAEVRLVAPGREVPYGRGPGHLQRLLQALALLGPGAEPRVSGGRPQPAPLAVDDRALRWATRLGGIWVYGSLILVEEMSPALLGALSPLLLLGLALERRGGPWLTRFLSDALSVVVLAFIVGFDWQASGVTVATTHLVAYLLLNRALSPLDGKFGLAFLTHFLGFFLSSGQTISLAYFVLFLGYCAYACVWLTLFAGARWDTRGRWLAGLARACAAAAGAGVAVFALTPRVDPRGQLNPIAAIGLDKLKSQDGPSTIGFTESVSLGYYGPLKRSTAKAMRVRPLSPGLGIPSPILVRGNAYDIFDGRQWSRQASTFNYRWDRHLYRALGGRAWSVRRGGQQRLVPAAPREKAFDM